VSASAVQAACRVRLQWLALQHRPQSGQRRQPSRALGPVLPQWALVALRWSPLTTVTSPDLQMQPRLARRPQQLVQQARHQLAPEALSLARLYPRLQRRQGPRLSLGLPAWLLAPQPLDLRLQPAPQRQGPPPLGVRARPRPQQALAQPVPRQVRPPGPGVGR
jgi:hypothetical protein